MQTLAATIVIVLDLTTTAAIDNSLIVNQAEIISVQILFINDGIIFFDTTKAKCYSLSGFL